jgi:hypothetical protein
MLVARLLGRVMIAALCIGTSPGPARAGDAFLAGYASAVLERELGVEASAVAVEAGVLTVRVGELDDDERERLMDVLSALDGIEAVRILPAAEGTGAAMVSTRSAGPLAGEEPEVPKWDLLPPGRLFDPLLADPRWPHFSASVQRYVDNDELGNVAAVSFGDVIPLVRRTGSDGGSVELALHAAVFSIFDIDADSFDLINSDFLVGPALSARRGSVSGMLRLFHQSSHLGDEFLLRRSTDRINLSYEAVDALVSWDASAWLRLYAGGGWLLRREPADLARASAQVGLEARSPRTWGGGHLRPIFGFDVQSRAESDWDLDLSARLGFQIESDRLASRRLQVLLDYFQGRSPNGQFFDREIEYWALGAHLHF